MTLLSNWIMQIINLMLIGTIVELLLPSNQMKKYVNLVLGLLLLLVLTQPILHLFSVDYTGMINRVETALFQDNSFMEQTEKSVELKKDEIQSTQDAYIWSEISSQMRQAANDSVEKEFAASITNIAIEPSEENDELGNIIVMLGPLDQQEDEGEERVTSISPVEIDIGKEEEQEGEEAGKEVQAIQQHLAEIWDVEASQIHIQWEGQSD